MSLYDDTLSLYDDTLLLYDDTLILYDDTLILYDGTLSLYDDTFIFFTRCAGQFFINRKIHRNFVCKIFFLYYQNTESDIMPSPRANLWNTKLAYIQIIIHGFK